jgi:ferredoxin
MPRVRFLRERKELDAPKGARLMDVMEEHGIGFDRRATRLCGGRGLCGACRVLVRDGEENVSAKSWIERLRTAVGYLRIGFGDDVRLACQMRIDGDVAIERAPHFNWWGRQIKYVTRDCD